MEKVVLVILDGYGKSQENYKNAVNACSDMRLINLFKNNPTTLLSASGTDVGLIDGQMGNSEVGHLNIGAGRVVKQDILSINEKIDNGEFEKNKILLSTAKRLKKENKNLHLIGLLSTGGVHSHLLQLFSLISFCEKQNLPKVYIHVITDGRDTNVDSGKGFLISLQERIKNSANISISSVMGRYYAMDREENYDRTKRAYECMVRGDVIPTDYYFDDAESALMHGYIGGETDEFILPRTIRKDITKRDEGDILDGDSVIFYNYRPDRMRQLVQMFIDENKTRQNKLELISFTKYSDKFDSVKVLFEKDTPSTNLTKVISDNGLKTLKIAETTKYAHVTYYLNGQIEKPYENEDRILIPMKKVATFDMAPKMQAKKIETVAIKNIKSKKYDFIAINIANCDMIGHTGNYAKTCIAVKESTRVAYSIANCAVNCGYVCVITADHGNAEKMEENGKIFTAHTLNPVEFCVCGKNNIKLSNGGNLSNVAPTILDIMGISKPKAMTSVSLINK